LKAVGILGSPRKYGNSSKMLLACLEELSNLGFETEFVYNRKPRPSGRGWGERKIFIRYVSFNIFWEIALEGESLEWMRPRSTRHAKYWCGYHFVWIPRYRRDVLVGDVAEFTGVVLNDILRELGCEPLALDVMPDHVHALCPPRHSPAYVVNYLKGKSARRIPQRFPELRTRATRERLWGRSYFVATADIVKKYAEERWEKER